ncbi:MAG: ubiquinol-cytochrome c reductase iron-sulfur subunit [Actinomycetota bacterium]
MLQIIEILGLVLAVTGMALLFLGRRRAPRPEIPGSPVARRAFLNRALLGSLGVFGVAFGGGTLGFVWPNVMASFGRKIQAGKLTDILARIRADQAPYYNAQGLFYLVPYDTSDPNNRYVKAGVAKQGIMAVYQKCAHLGCRVPFCVQSQWFECPCHASKYNLAGERMLGPAPAGLERFAIEIDAEGIVTVDTAKADEQPELGFDSLHQPPAGPFCVWVEDTE